MTLASFILGLVGSIVGRVLIALGFSVVTIVGFDFAIGQLKSYFLSNVNSMPYNMLNLFLLAGGGYAVNIIFSAITFRVAYIAITKSSRILGR